MQSLKIFIAWKFSVQSRAHNSRQRPKQWHEVWDQDHDETLLFKVEAEAEAEARHETVKTKSIKDFQKIALRRLEPRLSSFEATSLVKDRYIRRYAMECQTLQHRHPMNFCFSNRTTSTKTAEHSDQYLDTYTVIIFYFEKTSTLLYFISQVHTAS